MFPKSSLSNAYILLCPPQQQPRRSFSRESWLCLTSPRWVFWISTKDITFQLDALRLGPWIVNTNRKEGKELIPYFSVWQTWNKSLQMFCVSRFGNFFSLKMSSPHHNSQQGLALPSVDRLWGNLWSPLLYLYNSNSASLAIPSESWLPLVVLFISPRPLAKGLKFSTHPFVWYCHRLFKLRKIFLPAHLT